MIRSAALAMLLACNGTQTNEPTDEPAPVAPKKPPSPPPVIDAGPPVDAFELSGPPDGEAMARAFVTALGAGDEAGMRALLITPEINREFYRCDSRPDYPVDDRVRQSMADSMVASADYKALAVKGKLEVGTWTEHKRTPYGKGDSVTFVCHTNRDLAIVTGTLEFTVIDGKHRKPLAVAFILVEAMGTARLASATLIARDLAGRGSSGPR